MIQKSGNSVISQYNLPFDEVKTGGASKFPVKNTDHKEIANANEKMTSDKKGMLRTIFKLKIHEADGQRFEDLFTNIMRYADPEFQQIKPYGRAGDKKNDGYIRSKGIYFQVYGPEDISNSISYAKGKLKEDFLGLLKEWKPVNEFYFVINDKYKGIPPDLEREINKLTAENKIEGGIKGAGYLENLLFSLADDQIVTITGLLPDPSTLRSLDYSILDEVIDHIMRTPLNKPAPPDIKAPDWDKKIKFNGLSREVAKLLDFGSIQMSSLTEYLDNQGSFLGDELRDKMDKIYTTEKKHFERDELFLRIVNVASPKEETAYQNAVIVIMAKYFEACDIFERPPEDYL